MYKIAVFVSGRGSNLRAILESVPETMPGVIVDAVVSNKTGAPAGELARQNNIDLFFVAAETDGPYTGYSELKDIFLKKKIDLIVLAGFLKKIPDSFIDAFEGKIINIHPALLPSFGGKGMYGMNVHRAVFEKSCKVSGATIHFVDNIYDNGKIIAQKCVDINNVETPEDIAAKVLEAEHELLPYVIRKFAENKIKHWNNRIIIE